MQYIVAGQEVAFMQDTMARIETGWRLPYRLSTNQLEELVRRLAQDDAELASRIDRLTRELFFEVSINEVADELYSRLESITVEQCIEGAGQFFYGEYRDVQDVAYELIKRVCKPHLDLIGQFHQEGRHEAEFSMIKGVALALQTYIQECDVSMSPFGNDVAETLTSDLLYNLRQRHPGEPQVAQQVEEFINTWFSQLLVDID